MSNTRETYLNKLFIAVIAALSIATPASAGVFEEHKHLWNTLGELGVVTHINNPDMCEGDNDGAYHPYTGDFVVCQDKAVSDKEAVWTANDLDTIRHEAFHVLQDCLDGWEDNATLTPYNSPKTLAGFLADSSYTLEQLKSIAAHYKSRGADNLDVVLELEAFAAADSLSATQIANLLNRHCTN